MGRRGWPLNPLLPTHLCAVFMPFHHERVTSALADLSSLLNNNLNGHRRQNGLFGVVSISRNQNATVEILTTPQNRHHGYRYRRFGAQTVWPGGRGYQIFRISYTFGRHLFNGLRRGFQSRKYLMTFNLNLVRP